ncbi:MAG: DNA cytosine methyltransferase [Parvularculaceae bacterium]
MKNFLEFFAGGGMARIGLGAGWRCLMANDFDAMKCAAYRENFGDDDLVEADIASLGLKDLPKTRADLAWGSFPCQDLSLAGARAGFSGARSSLFFEFWRLMDALRAARRAPRIVIVENVTGLLTSNGGADFAAIVSKMAASGYRVSAMVVNASAFTPQSRPRLFIFGFGANAAPDFAARPEPDEYTPQALLNAVDALRDDSARAWRWIAARPFNKRNAALADLVDADAEDWRADLAERALSMMTPRQRAVIDTLKADGARHIGAAFRRVRMENGVRAQRVEARFDGLAGCLRTPAGGSSRQMLLMVEGEKVLARLMAPRETARLMGLPEDYRLPKSANQALKLCGDGVCAPVVRWISEAIVEPALGDAAAAA